MWPNWVDLFLILIPVLRACYVGFHSGLVASLVNALGVIGITALACQYRTLIAQWLTPWWPYDPTWLEYTCFLFILLIGLLLVHWLMRKLGTLVQWERLHWILQGLGLLVGAVRGLWWAGLFVLIAQSWSIDYFEESVQKRSLFGPHVHALAQEYIGQVAGWLPGGAGRTSVVPTVVIHVPQLPSINDNMAAPAQTGRNQKRKRR